MDTAHDIRTALQARRGNWPEICARTGLSYWWVTKFAQGRIADPGLSKIQKLTADFAEHPLPANDVAPLAKAG